ncbi:F-box/LRR-repeat protein 3-like isoform X1 [Acanthaster planci]|uniref:F-box/LRR-repeat protein 3-like isoform X1 n=1 Tax=Acanthaster planci TaxID=133434 RepID=A0A8B7Y0X1_ACAPL|nr:F-box/LRR-repeat protein 3-like isoform X1 [Acanthaster planci]
MEPSCSATSGRRDAERPPLRGGVVKLRSRESRAQRKRAVQLHLEQLARDLHLTGERQSVWALLPIDLLVRILKLLALPDRGRSAQVCTRWHATYHMPDLWHQFAFEFVQETALMASSTPASLIKQVFERHSADLRHVTIKVDSHQESVAMACDVLTQLGVCSLHTLKLSSMLGHSFTSVQPKQVTDSMRGILTNSPLKELAVAKTLIDDASLQTMADKSQATLTSLKINCCPALSASGITSVLGSCLHLCELTMDYHQVSDALLQAVSTPAHVPMKDISIRVVEPDSGDGSEPVPWQAISHVGWDSLSQHSPDVAFALHFLKLEEESYDHFFRHRLPATLLHFGCFIPRLVLCRVARHCPRLRTLLLANTGTDEPIDGPLAEIGERCLQLQEVQLSGALVSCAGLVCLAKLCGPRLTTLNIFEDMLLPDEECNEERMTQEVSHYLQRPWSAETFPTWPE